MPEAGQRKLQRLLLEAKGDLPPWQGIPEAKWSWIASRCGPEELAALRERIAELEAELATVEDWDGDTRDDIHKALHMFRQIAAAVAKAP